MLDVLRFMARRASLGVADGVVTSPLMRWTWTGGAEAKFSGTLAEIRPSDRETVREMMAGRYLLAGKLVETNGVSPFSLSVEHVDWRANLHGFSWLRHFRDVRDPGQRQFARTLVLDWIGRYGKFERASWVQSVCAMRVLNWLRHFNLLVEDANPEQVKTISRALAVQVQSLKLRARLSSDPLDALLGAIALVGAALCEDDSNDIEARLERLNLLLAEGLDDDGLHLSRSPRVQLQLLAELVSLRQSLGRTNIAGNGELTLHIEAMHQALNALTLGTGEPSYVNGTGQLPHDLLIAVQANGSSRARASAMIGGFCTLRHVEAVVIGDGGLVPPPLFAANAHSGALGFEFSHGRDLIVGNCGPAPAELPQSAILFRQGSAHSAPTIDGESADPIAEKGTMSGLLIPGGNPIAPELESHEGVMVLRTDGFAKRFGVDIERRITLMPEGTTLIGQDRMIATGKTDPAGRLALRFHLGAGAVVERSDAEDMFRIVLPSGAIWNFLWEGADGHDEESVRQSSSRGFHTTRQLVLETQTVADGEIAWIFTREQA